MRRGTSRRPRHAGPAGLPEMRGAVQPSTSPGERGRDCGQVCVCVGGGWWWCVCGGGGGWVVVCVCGVGGGGWGWGGGIRDQGSCLGLGSAQRCTAQRCRALLPPPTLHRPAWGAALLGGIVRCMLLLLSSCPKRSSSLRSRPYLQHLVTAHPAHSTVPPPPLPPCLRHRNAWVLGGQLLPR